MQELVKMICNTAYVNREFYDILVDEMKRSSKWCKLFVHGLPWTTTQETLYSAFSRFGQIQECVILKDRNGQSKGYGFINYSNAQEAINAINAGPQQIDGRMVGSDLAWKGRKARSSSTGGAGGGAAARSMANTASSNNSNTLSASAMQPHHRMANTSPGGLGGPLAMRRLFVYSLLYTTTDETLHSVFSQYGELEEAVIIKDKNNEMKSKGYGFVVYKNMCDAQTALKQPDKLIDGRTVHCSLAIHGQHNRDHHGSNNNPHLNLTNAAHGMSATNTTSPGLSAATLGALQPLQLAGLSAAGHPGFNALSALVQQQQALQTYDPYQNALYQAALTGAANPALGGAANPTQQLLQQLLAQQIQQQQLLGSQPNETNANDAASNLAPAPINPNNGYT